jgi:predicted deacylase
MKRKHGLILSLIVVTMLILLTHEAHKVCSALDVFEFNSTQTYPHVLLLGSTHGNEPAGSKALTRLCTMLRERNITLLVGRCTIVPVVNKSGNFWGTRNNVCNLVPYDINRNYNVGGLSVLYPINENIKELVAKADIVVDLHEGWGYHVLDPNSIGSGIYPGHTTLAQDMAIAVVNALNRIQQRVNKPSFVTSVSGISTKGDLMEYTRNLNKHYLLVETTGQNDIQPLAVRVSQHLFIVTYILWKLGVIREYVPLYGDDYRST